jgi:hypothetical protein
VALEKQCPICSKRFSPKNPKGRFCSTRCRMANFRKKQKATRDANIERLLRQLPLADPQTFSEFQETMRKNRNSKSAEKLPLPDNAVGSGAISGSNGYDSDSKQRESS